MFSFCHTQLASHTGGLNLGRVHYWFSEHTCNCSRQPHVHLVCLFLLLLANSCSLYVVMNSTELRHMFPVKSSRRNFSQRWRETFTCPYWHAQSSPLSAPHTKSPPRAAVCEACRCFFNSCVCREFFFSLTQNYSNVSPKSAQQAFFLNLFFPPTALGRH